MFLLKDEEAMALKGGKTNTNTSQVCVNVLSSFIVILTLNEKTVSINSPFGLPLHFKEQNAH
jgi:hypothetical protein